MPLHSKSVKFLEKIVVPLGVQGEENSLLEGVIALLGGVRGEKFSTRKDNQTSIHIGCAISASDGSNPQVYVRLLVVGHRLKRLRSSSPRIEEQICLRDLRGTHYSNLICLIALFFSSVLDRT